MTNTEVAKTIRGFYEQHVTALNGMLDKLPEPLKGQIGSLKDAMNAHLAKLPPLDQVPAAHEAGWALQSFMDSFNRMHEYAQGMLSRFQKMAEEHAGKCTAMNSLEEQIKNGELVAKDKVKELTEKAFNDGAASVMPSVVTLREQQVAAAGLPQAPKNILELAADKFQAAIEGAKKNLKALTDLGFALNGAGKTWVEGSAWLDETAFQGEMTKIRELLPQGKPAPAGTDPLLGGGKTDKTETKGGVRFA